MASLRNNSTRQIALYEAGRSLPARPACYQNFWITWTAIRGFRDRHENTRGDPGPLSVASSLNLIQSAQDLLQSGVNANEAGGFPLQAAATLKLHPMMILLLENGASTAGLARAPVTTISRPLVNPIQNYILEFNFRNAIEAEETAPKTDQGRVIDMLLERGVDNITADETKGNSLLSVAVLLGYIPLLTRLLAAAKNHQYFREYVTSGRLTVVLTGWDESGVKNRSS